MLYSDARTATLSDDMIRPRLILVFACVLATAAQAADAPPPVTPPSAEEAARDVERLIKAWSSANLAPPLIERCAQKFPDKAAVYRKALADWLQSNREDAEQGKRLYDGLIAARSPGADPAVVLRHSIDSVLARFDRNSAEQQLAQCEGAYLTLMVEGG